MGICSSKKNRISPIDLRRKSSSFLDILPFSPLNSKKKEERRNSKKLNELKKEFRKIMNERSLSFHEDMKFLREKHSIFLQSQIRKTI